MKSLMDGFVCRVFTSNKKLESLDDFNGQKLRMPNNPIHVKLAESLGANVVIMDMGEVFTALEQGVADGQDNPLATNRTMPDGTGTIR